MPSYSRLAKKQSKYTEQQIILIVVASIVLVVIIIYFGISFLFGLTSRISGLGKVDGDDNKEEMLAPNSPRISQEYSATSSAQIAVFGASDPKIDVELFQNGKSVGTELSSDQGKFSFDVTLLKGENLFEAQAISEQGGKSPKSKPYVVSLVTSEPKLEINTPADGDSVKDSPIVLSGKTDPGNSIYVNGHFIVVGNDGSFSYYLNLNDGDNKITVEAVDPAGNKLTKEMTIKLAR